VAEQNPAPAIVRSSSWTKVHRFNKAQQDCFPSTCRSGPHYLHRATTENPSFEVISPLLSRTKVYILDPLTTPQIAELLRRALQDRVHGFGNESIEASDDILFRIASFANGDARAAYNTLELAVRSAQANQQGARVITPELLEDVLQRKLLRMTKPAKSITTSSPRCTNPCAIPIPMPHSTGSRA